MIPEIYESKADISKAGLTEKAPPNIFTDAILIPPHKSIYEGVTIKPNIYEAIIFIVTKMPKLLYYIFVIIKQIEGLKDMTNDKKTTIIATVKVIMGIVTMVLALFKIAIPAEVSEAIIAASGSLYLLFSWLQGFFTNKKQ